MSTTPLSALGTAERAQFYKWLASHGEDWFLGRQFSVLDPFAFLLCRWTRGFGRPARSLPHLGPFLRRMLARPAVKRAFATEKLPEPFVQASETPGVRPVLRV